METYALNYVRKGKLFFGPWQGKTHILPAPIAFWTWPGPRWHYGPVHQQPWDHAFISWKGSRSQRFLKTNLFPVTAPEKAWLRLTDSLGFERAFFDLLNLLQQREPDDPAVVNRLEGLLLLLHQQPPRSTAVTGVAAGITDLIQEVRTRPDVHWEFAEEAGKLGCTPTYLRRVWKQQTGLTPVSFLQKQRIQLAAVLLRQNQRSVDRIMRDVGYEHPGYFYRLFRDQFGMAPGEYARAYQTTG